MSLTQKHRLCAKTFSDDLVNFSLALSWGTPQSSGFTQILQYVYLWRVHFGFLTYCVQTNEAERAAQIAPFKKVN